MFEVNAKLPTGILRDYGIGVLFAIFPNTVVLKLRKLQYAVVYNIKFRIEIDQQNT